MSKKASSAIHELISAMTKSEKRYFKLYASRHTIGEQNNYITLFNFIESMSTYNEDLIFSHFNGASFLNKFPITKTRLYDNIVRSLCAYYSNSSIDAQLYRILHTVEILFKKGLYDQASKQLISAEKLANKHDRYILLLEINKQKKRLVESNDYYDVLPEDIEGNIVLDQMCLEQQNYFNALWEIKSLLFQRMNQKGKIRSEEEKAYYDCLMDRLALLKTPKQPALESRFLRNQIISAYSYVTLLLGDAYDFHEKNLRLLKNEPKKIQEQPNLYFYTLTNLIHLETEVGSYASALDWLHKLKAFPQKYKVQQNEDFEMKMFSSIYTTEMMLLIKQGEFQKAVDLVGDIQLGLKKHGEFIAPAKKAYLMFKVAVAYFGLADFSTSLKWINKMLNDQSLDQTEDIMAFTQLLSLMVHFELGNFDLLPYAERSTQRFLKNRNRNYYVEKIILKFIRKASKVDHVLDLEPFYFQLIDDLNDMLTFSYESVALEYFDFLGWAESKAKKRSFCEVQKDKYLIAISE